VSDGQKEMLDLREGPERADDRIGNKEQSYESRLIVMLKGFRPAKMN
jgi:hypothetical protein